MIRLTKRKIKLDLYHIGSHTEEALYYIFCVVQSYCLNVKLKTSPNDVEIRRFFKTQKPRLQENGAFIAYHGPNFRDFGKKEIKYVFTLKHFEYAKKEPLRITVEGFYGDEYHKDIGIKNGVSMDISEKNGTKCCPFVYAGTINKSNFTEEGIVMNIIRGSMPVGFMELGKMINYFILKHFDIKVESP
jgi:hypothetical protein